MRRIKKLAITAILGCGTLLAAAPATAQEADGPVIVQSDAGLKLPKPDGWVEKEGAKGVVVRLQAAGDSKSYIDFRMAPDVDDKKAGTFFTSFHASLQASGLKKVRDTESTSYGKHVGDETEYETKGENGAFRLIIWQIHVGTRAWMIVGFFDADERDTLYNDFKATIATVSFGK